MRKMAKRLVLTALFCLLPILVVLAQSQEEESSPLDNIRWQQGPDTGDLGEIAAVQIPEGYIFADGDDTRILMEAMQNPVSDTELGFIAKEGSDWFLVFEFDETGYIKDDEKGSLDANAMLKSIKKSNEAGNREREKRGWSALNIVGWEQPPRYNPSTHNLEWALRAESEGEPVINWNTRVLGRRGVMKVTLVADPSVLTETLPHYHELLSGFDYKTGHRYAEYRQGDKLAKYGLSALVVGGAAAVAAKTGLFKYLWKILVAIAIAGSAFFKKLFSRKQS
jgi:uncharacterized membrane-anchored protein